MGCDHCGETFSSRRDEISHVLANHGADLTSHERDALKRERNELEEGSAGGVADRLPVGRGTGMVVLGLGIAAALLYGLSAAGIVSFTAGGDGPTGAAGGPYAQGAVHQHGSIEMTVAGEEVDLSQPRFYQGDSAFHFHDGYYQQYGVQIWHVHARGVTLRYALGTLGIDVNANGTVLTYDGTTYRESDPGTEIDIEVSGEPVEPGNHVLQGVGPEGQAASGAGDSVSVVVRTDT